MMIDLKSMILAASGGDTIDVTGEQVGRLALANVTFIPAVTIKGGEFSGLKLSNVVGLEFENPAFTYVEAQGDNGKAIPFMLERCADILFRNAAWTGSDANPDWTTNEILSGFPTGRGLYVNQSVGITLDGGSMRTFDRGVFIKDSLRTKIISFQISDVRVDAFNGAGCEGLDMDGVVIRDHRAHPKDMTHRDMIQFMSSGPPSTGVAIQNCILLSGTGPSWVQAIFCRSEAADKQGGTDLNLFHRNFRILNNVICATHYHGITIGKCVGVEISGNTLLQDGRNPDRKSVNTPHVNIDAKCTGVVVNDNLLSGSTNNVGTPPMQPGWVESGNVDIQNFDSLRPDHYSKHLVNPAGDMSTLAYIAMLPGSPITAGSGLLRSAPVPAPGSDDPDAPEVPEVEADPAPAPEVDPPFTEVMAIAGIREILARLDNQ